MSNFECPVCHLINIDCGKDGYKTDKEIKLETKLAKIKDIIINHSSCPRCSDYERCINCEDYVYKKILDEVN